jgi:hypothetical protein
VCTLCQLRFYRSKTVAVHICVNDVCTLCAHRFATVKRWNVNFLSSVHISGILCTQSAHMVILGGSFAPTNTISHFFRAKMSFWDFWKLRHRLTTKVKKVDFLTCVQFVCTQVCTQFCAHRISGFLTPKWRRATAHPMQPSCFLSFWEFADFRKKTSK